MAHLAFAIMMFLVLSYAILAIEVIKELALDSLYWLFGKNRNC